MEKTKADLRTEKFKKLIKKINYYPPYIGAAIKLKDINEDLTKFRVEMKLTWYNRNLVGTHFGGSLYAMCDPFYMFILMANLGSNYIVWDKYAAIDFLKPGKGKVIAEFEIQKDKIADIKQRVDSEGKTVVEFICEVKSESGEVISKVTKGVYVRKKDTKL
jgi:acyl-coenzyme A thioesterase PaaI-like protein